MTDTTDKFPADKALRLALALGIVWGGAMFLTGVVAAYTTTYAHELVRTLGSIYFWYDASLAGAFWGLLWGFMDTFLGTLLVALIYNAIGLHHHEPARHPEPVAY